MTVQDKIQFMIGQLTVSNMSLQEKVEQLEKEIEKLKHGAMGTKEEKPKLMGAPLKEVSKDA